jgi:hypothetical protein
MNLRSQPAAEAPDRRKARPSNLLQPKLLLPTSPLAIPALDLCNHVRHPPLPMSHACPIRRTP